MAMLHSVISSQHVEVCCRDFPVNQYTLPQVWDGVKGQADYAAKQKEVEEFNKSHAWLKRGVAVTPTRSSTLHAMLVSLRVFCALC